MKIFALCLFALTYLLLFISTKYRPWVALASAAIYVISGILPINKIFSSIDWNVILMLAGTMGTVSLFIDSRMPARLADLLINRASSTRMAVILLSLFAGIISAFVDNVATVLMVAPIGLAVTKKLNISPVPVVVAIAVSSNLQGAATLVGDTTSIMLGSYAGMDFKDFFWMLGKPGIFWSVELGAAATVLVLLRLFRNEKAPIEKVTPAVVDDYFPTVMLCGTVLLLILASFLPEKPEITNGLICVVMLFIGILHSVFKKRSFTAARKALREIDLRTLLLLAGLFIVVASIVEAGIVEDISTFFVKVVGDNLFLAYTVIVWASVLLSAFIDNIPYVAAMLPVVAGVATSLGVTPYVLYFGLLTGATLGGNISPVGASANITAIGILGREGHEVKARDFMRVGVPFTLVAVTVGYVFIWLVWGIN